MKNTEAYKIDDLPQLRLSYKIRRATDGAESAWLRTVCLAVTLLSVFILFDGGWAEESDGIAVGFRAGINDDRNDERFEQYEGFMIYGLPWSWRFASGWTLGAHLDANAGALKAAGEAAFVGSIGPGINVKAFGERLALWLGINPTIISRENFGDEDLGGPFQFTSYVGLSCLFIRHFSMGYRFKHMSNASIYDKNPGLNLHMFEISWRF